MAGTKVSWCEEYLPALARAFPAMRFVMPVRDVRAICASQNSAGGRGRGKRPLLFYVRHWRKSVAFARRYLLREPALHGRVRLVRYEDLVRRPREVLAELCEFLGLAFDPAMVDAGAFPAEDGSGPWTPNSSYGPGKGIYTSSLDRWREVLSEDEVATLEALAGPELKRMGYPVGPAVRTPLECLQADCEPPAEHLADWLRPHPCVDYLRDPHLRAREYAAEELRRAVLEGTLDAAPDLVRGLFLDRENLADLRDTWT